jgi:hypothetical protein
MKNIVFWDVTSCGLCEKRRCGGTYRLHHHNEMNPRGRNAFSPPASVASYCFVPSLLILFTLIIEAILPSETSTVTRTTRHLIPEDGILQVCHVIASIMKFLRSLLSEEIELGLGCRCGPRSDSRSSNRSRLSSQPLFLYRSRYSSLVPLFPEADRHCPVLGTMTCLTAVTWFIIKIA